MKNNKFRHDASWSEHPNTQPEAFRTTEQRRGTVMVEMNQSGILNFKPGSTERQAIGTSGLSGCIGIAAVYRSNQDPDDVSVILAHHPPSGNQGKAARNIRDAVATQYAANRVLERAVVMAPGRWAKDETTGYMTERPYDTVSPDVGGYTQVLGGTTEAPVKVVGYVPEHPLMLSFSPDKGTMLVELTPESDNIVSRISVEGVLR